MKLLSNGVALIALLAAPAVATSWLSKPAYSRWGETELQTWLADNNIPYPKSAQKTDLEKLVKENWENKVYRPYQEWEPSQLSNYLKSKGIEIEEKAIKDKDWLLNSVKKNWVESESAVEKNVADVKNWVFSSWSESQLKSFLDRHGIPNPNPRTRDTLLQTARENYQSVAEKSGQNWYYPGNWLYQNWSESDLKRWLDERGYKVPQPTTRDKLIAAVRRNSRQAALRMQEYENILSDSAFDSWSDSKIKQVLDEHGVNVPQGSTRNELLAIARRHKHKLSKSAESASASLVSAYGAATSSAGNQYAQATDAAGSQYAKATDAAHGYGEAAFDTAIGMWSESRLKYFLESRGVNVPQYSKKDELVAFVRAHKNKAQNKYGVWTFEDWSVENLKKWLEEQGHKTADSATATRNDLVNSAYSAVNSAQSAGEQAYATVTAAIASVTDSVKADTFDTWSDSELKSYLDSYGINTYQGSTRNKLLAEVRRQSYLFRNGGKQPGVWEKTNGMIAMLREKAWALFGLGQQQAKDLQEKGTENIEVAKEKAAEATEKVRSEL